MHSGGHNSAGEGKGRRDVSGSDYSRRHRTRHIVQDAIGVGNIPLVAVHVPALADGS
jgi:hypothetical protein